MLIEGMTIAGLAVGATHGFVYLRCEYPQAIRTMRRRHRAREGRGLPRRRCSGQRPQRSTSRCARRPAPTSAAKRRRCSRASKASAAWCAIGRRCRRSRGCSASRRSSTTCSRSRACRSILDKGADVLQELRHGALARHAHDPARRQHQARRADRARVRRDAARAPLRLRRRQRHGTADPRRAGRRTARRLPAPERSSTRRSTTSSSRQSARCSATAASSCSTTPSTWASRRGSRWSSARIESCGKCTPCRIGAVRGVEVIDRIRSGENETRERRIAEGPCDTMVTVRCARWAGWRRSRCSAS